MNGRLHSLARWYMATCEPTELLKGSTNSMLASLERPKLDPGISMVTVSMPPISTITLKGHAEDCVWTGRVPVMSVEVS